MQVTSDKIEGIELKIRQLAMKLERLEGENTKLSEENKKLRAGISEKTNALGLLEENLQKSQLSLGKPEAPKASKKLKKDIERYIRDIDKALEWLNKI